MPEPFSPIEISRFYETRTPQIRQVGKQWRGPCPIHGGQHNSFAVNPETGTWFCHSKCGHGGSLFDLERSLTGTTFPEAAASARSIAGRAEQSRKGPIVSTYDYQDEYGELLFQCVRHEPKEFSQRRRDDHGSWIWNLRGVRRVLFRLPTLSRADLVLVTEGEKDALNLVKLGFASLDEVDLKGTAVTEKGLAALRAARPKLRIFHGPWEAKAANFRNN